MSDPLAAGFARSEQLTAEWDSLKQEMSTLDPEHPAQCQRRTAISARMKQITTDLANVISHTRKILPTPHIDDDHHHHHNQNPQPPLLNNSTPEYVQYSARRRHVIQRTYDSTDDEADHDDALPPDDDSLDDDSLREGAVPTMRADEFLLPDAPEVPEVPEVPDILPDMTEQRQESLVDAAELRRSMMEEAGLSTDTVITVEGRSPIDRGLRAGLGGLGTKLKDKLREKPSKNSEEEREQLTLELSRIGREIRRLKRIPTRNRYEQKKLEDLQAKSARISEKLGLAPPEEGGPSPGEEDISPTNGSQITEGNEIKGRKSAILGHKSGTRKSQAALGEKTPKGDGVKRRTSVIFGARPPKPERKTSTVATAAGEHISRDCGLTEEEMELENMEEVSPQSTHHLGNLPALSKRKKGWLAFEAGVASIKALGKNVRTGLGKGEVGGKQSPVSNASSPDGTKPCSFPNNKAKSPNAEDEDGGNAFAEAAARVKQRGEKLGNAAEGSEQMASDAGDMLAAVRAMRERSKGGKFS